MDKRTEKFLKQTRQKELDKYILCRTPIFTQVVDLGNFKVPIAVRYSWVGLKLTVTDWSYCPEPPPDFWSAWRDASVGNHAARVTLNNRHERGQDSWILFSPGVAYESGMRFEVDVYFNYVEDPIIWREECGTQKGVERWLLRVEQPQRILDADGNDVPYGDPNLEWL